MNGNRGLFGPFNPTVPVKNNIDAHIKEYADNFCERLFRHLYKEAEVTLQNVFVQPKICAPNDSSQELISILGNFFGMRGRQEFYLLRVMRLAERAVLFHICAIITDRKMKWEKEFFCKGT